MIKRTGMNDVIIPLSISRQSFRLKLLRPDPVVRDKPYIANVSGTKSAMFIFDMLTALEENT